MNNKKQIRYLNVGIDETLYKELEYFSNSAGILKKAAVEHGLRQYLDDFYHKHADIKADVIRQMNGDK